MKYIHVELLNIYKYSHWHSFRPSKLFSPYSIYSTIVLYLCKRLLLKYLNLFVVWECDCTWITVYENACNNIFSSLNLAFHWIKEISYPCYRLTANHFWWISILMPYAYPHIWIKWNVSVRDICHPLCCLKVSNHS